jgi:hypothetical protein
MPPWTNAGRSSHSCGWGPLEQTSELNLANLGSQGLTYRFSLYSLRLAVYNSLPPYPSVHLAFEGPSIQGNALLGGLAAFILAEVFAYGLQLREDVEATI